eukprot:scaffold15471_cov217-Isochrysis_galbana.AAC.1
MGRPWGQGKGVNRARKGPGYGICLEPSFSALRLPLLDRGMCFVIAHVRGGGEMGRGWYEEQGKYLTKKNTFFDFVDCAKYLQARRGWHTYVQVRGVSSRGRGMGILP